MRKTFISIALLAVFCCCSSSKEKEWENTENITEVVEDSPIEVKAMPVLLQDFHYELISNGTIAALQKADLRFQLQEPVVKIHVKNGDRVVKGQKLAELDSFKQKIGMEQAAEAFERAKLDLQDALIGQGYSLSDSARIPQEVMKIAKIRSNYEQSQNNLKLAQYNFEMTTLHAPFNGVIANLTVKEFNLPGGDPFCTVVDNQNPEVVFNILENELPLVNLNDRVIVSPFSQSDYMVEGRISEINPVIDQNGMVRVKAVVGNRENKFHEGMNVKVRVQRVLSKQLVIPKSAVVLRTNRKVVFTLRDNKAMWNYVETAQENSDSYVLIQDKINAGDSVIYDGNMNLMDQVSVILER